MSNKLLISFDGPGSIHVYEPVDQQTQYAADQVVLPNDVISEALSSSFPGVDRSGAHTVAAIEKSAPQGGPIVRLFRRFLVNHVMEQTGRSEADVVDAVGRVESTSKRPLLDWLTNGGLSQLISLIVQILSLLGPVA